MRIIAVANHKGGVGKTTLVASLGPLFARAGYRVLLIDLDPQCSLTESLIDFEPERSVLDAFLNPRTGAAGIVIPWTEFREPVAGMCLIPASPEMSCLEAALSGRTSRELTLTKILRNLNAGRDYDIILMDCPPDLYAITVNALTACNELLVPTLSEYLPLRGLKKLEAKCAEIAEDLNPGLRITGIVVNRYNGRKNLNVSVDEALRRTYGDTILRTRIRENVRIAESPQAMRDIVSYSPGSNGARDYIELAKELIERFEREDGE